VELDQTIDLEPGSKVRLRNAGHVLGSAIAELWVEDEGKEIKIVFTGDMGKHDQLIVADPFEIVEADYLFIESTYGDRFHRTFEESKAELLEAIKYAISNKEKVIIPAFALERTQEILYLLGEFYRAGQLPDIPIYLDSPLAIKATEIFRRNKKYYDEAAQAIVGQGFDPFDMPNLKLTSTAGQSMKINQQRGSAIIIAGNGMCTAGRIKHHLKHNLWRPGASVVIVGFQAEGTTGRQIVNGAKMVTIFGQKIAVKAKVFTIGGLSAHADQADLLGWVSHFAGKSKPRVFVIHGEGKSSEALANAIRRRFGLDVHVPQWREVRRRWGVIPANNHDLSVTTEHESAAIEYGATDASRPAGFIRACPLLLDGLWILLQQGNIVPRTSRQTRPSTDEPSAHPWHQISNSRCTKGRHFQVKAGIQGVESGGTRDFWTPAFAGVTSEEARSAYVAQYGAKPGSSRIYFVIIDASLYQ
jgi:Cft2 family RNA processing exonuclease